MQAAAMVWLLWFGSGNAQVTVAGIATEEACHQLAADMKKHQSHLLPVAHVCIKYLGK